MNAILCPAPNLGAPFLRHAFGRKGGKAMPSIDRVHGEHLDSHFPSYACHEPQYHPACSLPPHCHPKRSRGICRCFSGFVHGERTGPKTPSSSGVPSDRSSSLERRLGVLSRRPCIRSFRNYDNDFRLRTLLLEDPSDCDAPVDSHLCWHLDSLPNRSYSQPGDRIQSYPSHLPDMLPTWVRTSPQGAT
jgi:hypothetical protein